MSYIPGYVLRPVEMEPVYIKSNKGVGLLILNDCMDYRTAKCRSRSYAKYDVNINRPNKSIHVPDEGNLEEKQ